MVAVGKGSAQTDIEVYASKLRYPTLVELISHPDDVLHEFAAWSMDDPGSTISAPYKAALDAVRGETIP